MARSGADKSTSDIGALAGRLGHEFTELVLLDEALTHPSIDKRTANGRRRHYDRLEFLGDRVLGLIVADALIERFPSADAGELARRFNAAVRQESLAEAAMRLDLGQHLRLSKSERESGGAAKPAILADAFEAVVAALFLDGGLGAAQRFVRRELDQAMTASQSDAKDAKTTLQEWAAARALATPLYEVVTQSGPAHRPHFVVAANLDGGRRAEGEGTSKRMAEQAAAAALLAQLIKDKP